jgi:hypothetical protein
VTTYDARIARVVVDEKGDWILTVDGTDVRQVLWNDRELEYGSFPGNSMGHRLIERGWMPDRRRMYGLPGMSPVQRLTATAYAGWEQVAEKAWTIPCYREQE